MCFIIGPKFDKNLGFSLSEHCEWGNWYWTCWTGYIICGWGDNSLFIIAIIFKICFQYFFIKIMHLPAALSTETVYALYLSCEMLWLSMPGAPLWPGSKRAQSFLLLTNWWADVIVVTILSGKVLFYCLFQSSIDEQVP